MPIYEYQCLKCQFRFEKLMKFSDPPPGRCPECGGKVQQLMSASSVQFKGSGWYVTDYGHKSSHAAGGKNGKPAEAKAETETKAETKSEKSEAAKPEPPKSESKHKHKHKN